MLFCYNNDMFLMEKFLSSSFTERVIDFNILYFGATHTKRTSRPPAINNTLFNPRTQFKMYSSRHHQSFRQQKPIYHNLITQNSLLSVDNNWSFGVIPCSELSLIRVL